MKSIFVHVCACIASLNKEFLCTQPTGAAAPFQLRIHWSWNASEVYYCRFCNVFRYSYAVVALNMHMPVFD